MNAEDLSAREQHSEQWIFGGSRLGAGGKRRHAWVDHSGHELLFKASGTFIVGSGYTAQVTREDTRVFLHGQPVYTGERSDDVTLIDTLSARHRAAEVALALAARERHDKRQDPLEIAVRRLIELADHVPPAQQTGFAVYVAMRMLRRR